MKKKEAAHPLLITSGENKGKMPHELEDDDFNVWLIVEGMNESDYWHNVGLGDRQLADIAKKGKVIPTSKLTPDQRGWAKIDHPQNFERPDAQWLINPAKPSKPLPVESFERNRYYSNSCLCGDDYDPALWGRRHDGVMMVQCENCGEVLVPDIQQEAA